MNGTGGRVVQVTDVLERLLAEFGEDPEQRPALFQAALRACAEESRRSRRGQPASGLDALVGRARQLLHPLQPKPKPEAGPAGSDTLSADPPLVSGGRIEDDLDLPAVSSAADDSGLRVAWSADLSDAISSAGGDRASGVADAMSSPSAVDPDGDAAVSAASSAAGAAPSPFRRAVRPAALGVAAFAALAYLVLQFLTPGTSASNTAARTAPTPGPVAAAPPPVKPATAQGRPVPSALPLAPLVEGGRTSADTPPAPPAGYAETMASPDWVGHSPTYAIHYSSFREKGNAERDAARVERQFGTQVHVVRVTIPGRGEFFRVVLDGFESAAAARSYRSQVMAELSEVPQIYWLVPLQ